MTQDIWIGIEVTADQAIGWRFEGTTPQGQAKAATAAEVTRHLGAAPTLIVQDDTAGPSVPAKALPASLPFTGLTQAKPLGYLDAAARLRIVGALWRRRNWDGVICLPMQHVTHWCQISADEIVSFQSALTPHLTGLLGAADHSHPDAVSDTMSRPEKIALHLRSARLLQAGDMIMGHLLGAELAAMRPYWLGQQVLVIADTDLYVTALASQGVQVARTEPMQAASQGLVALRTGTDHPK
jgi:hypothetical protein